MICETYNIQYEHTQRDIPSMDSIRRMFEFVPFLVRVIRLSGLAIAESALLLLLLLLLLLHEDILFLEEGEVNASTDAIAKTRTMKHVGEHTMFANAN